MNPSPHSGNTELETLLQSLGQPLGPDESILPRVMATLDRQATVPAARADRVRAPALFSPPILFSQGRQFQAMLGFSLMGVAIALMIWMGLFTRPGLTMAEVAQAVAKEKWAHLVYDDQMEVWVCMDNGRYLWKRKGGMCFHCDPINRTEETYDPALAQITLHKPDVWVLGVTRNGKTIPMQVDALQFPDVDRKAPEKNTIQAKDRTVSVEYSIEHRAGQDLGRFDESRQDALGQMHLARSLWVDLKTKLPVRVRERMNAADREKEGREHREGTYSFLETGPVNLAQLGVPVGTPVQNEVLPTRVFPQIVELYKGLDPARRAEPKVGSENAALAVLPPDTRRALKGAADRIVRFPRNLRILEAEGGTRKLSYWSASLAYMSNLAKQVLRQVENADEGANDFRYFSADNQDAEGVPEPLWEFTRDSELPIDRILKWFPFARAVNTHLVDGAKTYRLTRLGPPQVARLHVLGGVVSGTPPPFTDQWEYATWNTTELSAGKPGEAADASLIVVRSERANLKKEWHVDPQKDFAAVRVIEWRKEKEQWRQTSNTLAVGWKQLPGGAWYVSAWEITQKFPAAKKDLAGKSIETEESSVFGRRVEITAIHETDFPQGIFDGKKFVENAVKEGARVVTD